MADLSFTSVTSHTEDSELATWQASQDSDAEVDSQEMLIHAQYSSLTGLFVESEKVLSCLLSIPPPERAPLPIYPSATAWAQNLLLQPHSPLAETFYAVAVVCLSQARAHTEEKVTFCSADNMQGWLPTVLAASTARLLDIWIEENRNRRTSAIVKSTDIPEVGELHSNTFRQIKHLDQKGVLLERSRDLVLNALHLHGAARALRVQHVRRTWDMALLKALANRCQAPENVLRIIDELEEEDMLMVPDCMHLVEECKFMNSALQLEARFDTDRMRTNPTCLTRYISAEVILCASLIQSLHQVEEEERMKPYIRLSVILDYLVDLKNDSYTDNDEGVSDASLTDTNIQHKDNFENERLLWIDIIDEILPKSDKILRQIYALVDEDKEKGSEGQASQVLPHLQDLQVCYGDDGFLEDLLSL